MVDTFSSMESNKRELQLSINSFDNPTELSDVKAWSQLILQLLFLEPGTYPSIPEMGIGIEKYQYDFIDEVVSELSAAILNQQQTYLKDIPLTSVQVAPATVNKETILLIQLTFDAGRGSEQKSVIAVNASPKSRNFLDFDVSWI